jgi:hypothetical protein
VPQSIFSLEVFFTYPQSAKVFQGFFFNRAFFTSKKYKQNPYSLKAINLFDTAHVTDWPNLVLHEENMLLNNNTPYKKSIEPYIP